MSHRSLDELELSGARVLVRVDLNVPMDAAGEVTDATRLEAAVPTIRDILAAGGTPILLAHFGRPKGKPVPEMSLAPVRAPLEAVLGTPVAFCPATVGPEVDAAIAALAPGATLMLENTRFHAGEEANDADFAAALAAHGDVYVNDAFSCAHRAHASTEGVARLLPAAAGRSMERELQALAAALTEPKRPVVAVVGGAKVSTKLDLLGNLVGRVDAIVIGGGMANTFLHARGIGVGASLCEHEMAGTAREIEERAASAGCEILLPVDAVVAREFKAGAPSETVAVEACPEDAMILDAGPRSVSAFENRFAEASTVVWNGPLGAFEIAPFDAATTAAARAVAGLTRDGRLLSVAGGGDTVAALNKAGVAQHFSFVSTAGGAFLEWLEGRVLPGVAALAPTTRNASGQ